MTRCQQTHRSVRMKRALKLVVHAQFVGIHLEALCCCWSCRGPL